jgi:homoserine kinase
MPWLDSLLAKAREAGAAGAALSGAGTTVLALCAPGRAHDVASAFREAARSCNLPGRAEVLEVGVPGARAVDSP